MIHGMKTRGYNTRIFFNDSHIVHFIFPEYEHTAIIDPADVVLKSPHPLVSGDNRHVINIIFDMNLQVIMLNKIDNSEVECQCFCHLK